MYIVHVRHMYRLYTPACELYNTLSGPPIRILPNLAPASSDTSRVGPNPSRGGRAPTSERELQGLAIASDRGGQQAGVPAPLLARNIQDPGKENAL